MPEEFNKSFKYWKTQEVEEAFGIRPSNDRSRLDAWLSAKCEISEEDKKWLSELQKHLCFRVDFWNYIVF